MVVVRGVATGGVGVGGVTPPQIFKKLGKFGQNKGKFGQNNGEFCHKWQHLWLLVHPIKFGQFYRNSIFGRFNESGFATPLVVVLPIRIVQSNVSSIGPSSEHWPF